MTRVIAWGTGSRAGVAVAHRVLTMDHQVLFAVLREPGAGKSVPLETVLVDRLQA